MSGAFLEPLPAQFVYDLVNDVQSDFGQVFDHASHQRGVAQRIDQPGYALGEAMHVFDGRRIKNRVDVAAGYGQPMA